VSPRIEAETLAEDPAFIRPSILRRWPRQARSQLRGSGGLSPPSRASWRLQWSVVLLRKGQRVCH